MGEPYSCACTVNTGLYKRKTLTGKKVLQKKKKKKWKALYCVTTASFHGNTASMCCFMLSHLWFGEDQMKAVMLDRLRSKKEWASA